MERRIGEVPSFDVEVWLKMAQILVNSDEPERAIKVLTDMLPAYYRDNPPAAIRHFLQKIYNGLMTGNSYRKCADDSVFCDDPKRASNILNSTLRGHLLKQAVGNYNNESTHPHIFEMGGGEFWLPIGLTHDGFSFSYNDVSINDYAVAKSQAINKANWDGQSPVIFVACEVIEHLHSIEEMKIEITRYLRGYSPSEIHLSTPLYTYDPKERPINDLEPDSLPHLRAYTPREFIVAAQRLWPNYDWQLYMSPIMSLRGVHPDAKFKEHLKV